MLFLVKEHYGLVIPVDKLDLTTFTGGKQILCKT